MIFTVQNCFHRPNRTRMPCFLKRHSATWTAMDASFWAHFGRILGAFWAHVPARRMRRGAFPYFRRVQTRFSSRIVYNFFPHFLRPKHPFAPNVARDQNEAMNTPKIGSRWRVSKRAGRLRSIIKSLPICSMQTKGGGVG